MSECREIALSETYGDFIVSFVGDEAEIIEAYSAACYQRISSFYGIVYRPLDDIEELSLSNYSYNSIPALYGLAESDIRLRQRDVEVALEEAGIYRLQNQPALRLQGEGCIMAFIDTGINIDDEVFRYTNGDTRILRLWDMTDNSGTPPSGILYGSEYSREAINMMLENQKNEQNRLPGYDDIGHGNILASIAAGNNGAVPQCDIVVVKLKPAKRYLREFHMIREDVNAYQENDIMLAVNYVKNIGLNTGRPVSLCMALGTNSRSHDGRSALSYILDSFESSGSAMASVAAGEEGGRQLHITGNIIGENEYVNVEFRVDSRQDNLTINIWGSNPQVFSVGIISPTGEVIDRVMPRLRRNEKIDLIFEESVVNIQYDLAEDDSGDQLILIRISKPTEGVWTIRLYGEISLDNMSYNRGTTAYLGRFDAYMPIGQFIYDNTYFLTSEPDTTIIDPGYAREVVTATAYNPSSGALYVGQGRGFGRNGSVKPDLATPVSVAVLAGAISQLQNWGKRLGNNGSIDSAELKSYLIRGANREGSDAYPNTQWGYGKLDVYNALEILR